MILQAEPFNDWAKMQPCPQSTIEFSNYLFADGNFLSLKDDILSLNFHQHQKLYSLLKAHSPNSHKALYSRNVWFKALEEDILTVKEKGQTPRDAIAQLKRGLTLGGTILTGQEFA